MYVGRVLYRYNIEMSANQIYFIMSSVDRRAYECIYICRYIKLYAFRLLVFA